MVASHTPSAAQQRSELIMAQLREGDGSVHVEQLSRDFGVSVATIRRDLDRLVQDGRVARTYGGAVIHNLHAEQTLRQREVSHAEAKDAIARAATRMVQPGSTIFLDAGTTTGRLALHLSTIRGLTILTHGLNALLTLADSDTDADVIALGGHLRRTNQALIVPIAESVVENIYTDIAFLGTDCLDVERGVSSRTLEQNNLKRLMAAHARRTIVLADSSKLDATWSTYWQPLPPPYTLVTDDTHGEEVLEPFLAADHVDVTVGEVHGQQSESRRAWTG